MCEDQHLEAAYEDSVSQVAAEDSAYWDNLYAEDDNETEDSDTDDDD